ncbi:MAG: sodium:calcium antiporter [Anaerolineales bacterium]|nr:sodium:calcium antiporter [Anaerolineales bacterium]MCS7248725.1 sodium:calcium antiporter [Anaerolineales bacterium]MDW8162538.1 sodium:calcium antiporter [Anaerolineales bacterium]MDW8447529.1 sodium:calcium antiporter [Anaerolineales bacterium]
MNAITDVLIILASVIGLWWGAVWIVESAVRIARRVGLSELIIGLTVVAIGTSAPEFAVTVGAALEGQGDISVGNVVGSNIFNLGFILGSVAVVRAIRTTRTMVVRDGGMLIGTSLLLLLFLWDHQMTRLEGGILMVILLLYLGYLIWKKEPIEDEVPTGEFRWWDVPRLIAGIALVVGSGHFLVESAVHLARLLGVSEWVIGVTIVAAGTSSPEFATSLIAVLRGRHGVSAGNLIGSDLFNLLGVLGLAAAIQPMVVDASAVSSVVVLVGMVVLIVVFLMRTGWQISRWEGALLIAINLLRWILDFSR